MAKSHHYSDGELLLALRSGESIDASVSYLYTAYFDNLTNFIRVNQGSQQDAEDVFQEMIVVFIDLVQRGKFRSESSIKTFLYAIMRNLWLNELKKRHRSLVRDTEYHTWEDRTDQDISERIEANEARRQVFSLMDKLGDMCKRILVYYYYDNLSMKDIVERLNYDNEQVVRNKKYKCMKDLNALLDRNSGIKNAFKELLVYGI